MQQTKGRNTMNTNEAKQAVGTAVQINAYGVLGVLKYVTADGYLGVREPSGLVYEWPAHLVEIDPT